MTKEEYEQQKADLLQGVPAQYREKVEAKAWQDGHAYGYQEVLGHLEELVDIFGENTWSRG